MITMLKSILAAAALFAAAHGASAMAPSGLETACSLGSLTPNGVWDCR